MLLAFVAALLAWGDASGLEADYVQPDGFRVRSWVVAVASGALALVAFASGLTLLRRP